MKVRKDMTASLAAARERQASAPAPPLKLFSFDFELSNPEVGAKRRWAAPCNCVVREHSVRVHTTRDGLVDLMVGPTDVSHTSLYSRMKNGSNQFFLLNGLAFEAGMEIALTVMGATAPVESVIGTVVLQEW